MIYCFIQCYLSYSTSDNVTAPISRVLIGRHWRHHHAITQLENVCQPNIRRSKKLGFQLSHKHPLAIFIHLVIFLAVCWEIWHVHLFEKFIFDLTEWPLLDDKIYQSSTSSNRIILSISAKNKVCISLIWRK